MGIAEVRARESGGAEVGYRRTRVSSSRCGDLDKRQDSSAMIKDHYYHGGEMRDETQVKRMRRGILYDWRMCDIHTRDTTRCT